MIWAGQRQKGTGLKTTIELLKREGYSPKYLNDVKNDTFTLILTHPIPVGIEQVANMWIVEL